MTVVDLNAYRSRRDGRRAVEAALYPLALWIAFTGAAAAVMARPVAMGARLMLAHAEGVMAMGSAAAEIGRRG